MYSYLPVTVTLALKPGFSNQENDEAKAGMYMLRKYVRNHRATMKFLVA
jgi:hypothetical protein